MDPFKALGIACNVVDLINMAIKCGITVKIYSSADGFKKQQAVVQKSADEMNKIVQRLREDQQELTKFTKDEELQRTASDCMAVWEDLRASWKTTG